MELSLCVCVRLCSWGGRGQRRWFPCSPLQDGGDQRDPGQDEVVFHLSLLQATAVLPLLCVWQLRWGVNHTTPKMLQNVLFEFKKIIIVFFWTWTCAGLWPSLSVGEQLHRQKELPLLLPLPAVADGSHHGRVRLRPPLHPLPSAEHWPPARHCHVSLIKHHSLEDFTPISVFICTDEVWSDLVRAQDSFLQV